MKNEKLIDHLLDFLNESLNEVKYPNFEVRDIDAPAGKDELFFVVHFERKKDGILLTVEEDPGEKNRKRRFLLTLQKTMYYKKDRRL